MKIGLVGEAPNDTMSIQNLLGKRYSDGFEFVFLLNNISGSNLDNQKTSRLLRLEYESRRPKIVVFIRDLDSVLPNKNQILLRKKYFSDSNSIVNKCGIFLLHVYEIEALILQDIETFNSKYNVNVSKIEHVMKISEPKEELRKYSSKYNESHNPDLFLLVNFDEIMNCDYFSKFIKKLDKKILRIKQS
jgi:hypothetical protein